jgi:hypothetical protein
VGKYVLVAKLVEELTFSLIPSSVISSKRPSLLSTGWYILMVESLEDTKRVRVVTNAKGRYVR